MQWEGGHLHQESGGEEPEDPVLAAGAQGMGGEVLDVEVDRPAIRGQDPGGDRADQHQQGPHQRVDDHLDHGRLRADRPLVLLRPAGMLGPPAPEQEVERDQHQVEEEDEEDQVLGQEGAEHGRLGEAEHQEVDARPLRRVDRGPERGREPEDGGEQDQEEADPVDAQLVADAESRDPALVDGVLDAARGVELRDDDDSEDQGGERAQCRHPAADSAGGQTGEQASRQRRPKKDLDHVSLLMTPAGGSRGRGRRSR